MYRDEPYALVDDALIRLRRLWSGITPHAAATTDEDVPVEMSTVFVVDAIHRLQVSAPKDEVAEVTEVTVAAIASRLDVAASTASRLIDRAVTASMVTREPSAVDTRRVALTLTPQGQTLVTEASAFRRSYLERTLAGWTMAEVDTFAHLLDRFATDIHQHPPTPQRGSCTLIHADVGRVGPVEG